MNTCFTIDVMYPPLTSHPFFGTLIKSYMLQSMMNPFPVRDTPFCQKGQNLCTLLCTMQSWAEKAVDFLRSPKACTSYFVRVLTSRETFSLPLAALKVKIPFEYSYQNHLVHTAHCKADSPPPPPPPQVKIGLLRGRFYTVDR